MPIQNKVQGMNAHIDKPVHGLQPYKKLGK